LRERLRRAMHGIAANPAGHADPEVAQVGQGRREERRAGPKVRRGHAEKDSAGK
jgi:hypothetical protein